MEPIIIGLIIDGLIQAFACALITASVLKAKGCSESEISNWTLAAFFFGILGLLGAIGLPVKSETQRSLQW
jgi:hypothetical protein